MRIAIGAGVVVVSLIGAHAAWAGPSCCPAEAAEAKDTKACATEECAAEKAVPAISAASLKKLVDAKAPVVVLDARTGKWDDGRRIPGAKALAPDASAKAAESVVATKDTQIVTYCAGVTCPAGAALAKRLKELGYKNVSEFHEGIAGWAEAGYPVEQAKK